MTNTTAGNHPINGNWNEQKAKLKAKLIHITDADLQHMEGKKGEMFKRIAGMLGKTMEELKDIISHL